MRRAPRVFLSIVATLPLVVGAPTLAQSPTPVPVLDVEWTLSRLDGEAVPADPAITATFANSGSLTGSGGCNHYSATWTSDGSTLSVTGLTATRMACSDEVDAREASYLRLLEDAASWALDGAVVTVTTTDGATLVFGEEATSTDLALVGSWTLATVDDEAPPAGMTVTLDIGADGTLSGTACNSYSAGYTATEDGELSVEPVLSTRMSCGTTQDAFEADYFVGLQGATSWGTQGGQLFVYGATDLAFGDGGAVDATLTGQEWLLTAIDGTPVDTDSGISVSFGDDGSVSGSGGCNRFMGSYTVDGESLSVGPLASTRMACEGDVNALESSYLDALEAASGFAISGDELVVSTTGDTTLEFRAAGVQGVPPQSPRPSETPTTSAVDIVGGWKMTTYANQPLPVDLLDIDITFHEDGTFSGFGGCNDYMGQWSLDGTSLTISGFESASSGTCDQLTQGLETGYFSLLPFLDTVKVGEDGSLSLLSALGGNQGFEFVRAD